MWVTAEYGSVRIAMLLYLMRDGYVWFNNCLCLVNSYVLEEWNLSCVQLVIGCLVVGITFHLFDG